MLPVTKTPAIVAGVRPGMRSPVGLQSLCYKSAVFCGMALSPRDGLLDRLPPDNLTTGVFLFHLGRVVGDKESKLVPIG